MVCTTLFRQRTRKSAEVNTANRGATSTVQKAALPIGRVLILRFLHRSEYLLAGTLSRACRRRESNVHANF